MRLLIASAALAFAAPAFAQADQMDVADVEVGSDTESSDDSGESEDLMAVDYESKEYKFVACVNERDQSLLYAMRDADSAEGFQEAAVRAFTLCEEEAGDGNMSMGKFFNSVASFIGKPEYDEDEFDDAEAGE